MHCMRHLPTIEKSTTLCDFAAWMLQTISFHLFAAMLQWPCCYAVYVWVYFSHDLPKMDIGIDVVQFSIVYQNECATVFPCIWYHFVAGFGCLQDVCSAGIDCIDTTRLGLSVPEPISCLLLLESVWIQPRIWLSMDSELENDDGGDICIELVCKGAFDRTWIYPLDVYCVYLVWAVTYSAVALLN